MLNVVDQVTRGATPEMLVERSIDADNTVSVGERFVAQRSAPSLAHVRMENGTELAHALKDCCRFALKDWCPASARRGQPYIESIRLATAEPRSARASSPGCATSCSTSRNSATRPRHRS